MKDGESIMNNIVKFCAISILAIFIHGNQAWCAGYEKVYLDSNRPLESVETNNGHVGFLSALKEASLIDHAPPILDEFALTLRTLLSQFGLGAKN